MIKKLTITLLITAIGFMFAATAFAADLSVQLDKFNNTLTITNTLGNDLYVMGLVSGNKNIPLHTRLKAGASASIQLKITPPKTVDNAKCIIFGAAPAGYNKGTDGYFSLSVNYTQ